MAELYQYSAALPASFARPEAADTYQQTEFSPPRQGFRARLGLFPPSRHVLPTRKSRNPDVLTGFLTLSGFPDRVITQSSTKPIRRNQCRALEKRPSLGSNVVPRQPKERGFS